MLFDFLRRAARNAVHECAGVNDAVAEALGSEPEPEGEREAPEVEGRVKLLVDRRSK